MTDKVKILIKVTRRIDEILKMGDTGVTHLQELETLTDLQTFISSLSEEPVNKDLEEEYHEFLKREWFGKPGKTISEQMFFTAQYFAQWQKEKILSIIDDRWIANTANEGNSPSGKSYGERASEDAEIIKKIKED